MSFQTGQQAQSSSSSEPLQPCRRFTISEIQIATQNFDESLVIGSGGFGKVYKGTVANEGSLLDVAVKRLEATSNQGAVEFLAEIETLSKLRHCHLVSLIGYCNDGQEMILVYQYMPHGTLAHHLHKLGTPLSWVRRLKICIGAARGLHYLHTGTGINHGVIHRDVKSSNILLDDCWEAKISDFGLSKIGPTNQPCTSVSTLVKGTFGYLDPDYVFTGRLTRKSDVYAFGVVLFEVLCGKQAVDRSLDEEQWSLARWAQDSIKEVEGRSLKSLDIYLYTVGGENRILRRFDFDTINVATESFSKLMFRQSVGDMYKGRLQNGQDIAILERSGSFSFSNYECEMNEASALVKLEHKNLVQLLGYCIAGTKVYFLYDIALYANLNDLIHGRAPLDWVEQYKILLGVAHALVYLHKHASIRVMHADVNLHNIFLDERLVPKLSGFWFSRCSKVNEPDCIAVHAICGTCRFMAPEYALHGCLSTKADVFNFGFLVLQVVFWSTSLWRLVEVPHQLGERDWIDSLAAMSPRVGVANLSSISRFIRVALLCIQEDASDRPSMDAVIGMLLNNSSHSIPLPGRPPSLWWTRGFSYNTEYDAGAVEEFEFEPDDYDVEAVEEFKSELIPR
ncbi:probable receptor-like protein kinase At5g20050 isoform X2 [Cynara cardunculus var. scolymus]|uniref:probable receptor-like protein kinase At5g20050 isoform X2 n=1 Tax=Cynara cardunculus var. scolymus TaxID=59895 RepID=UPI000D62B65D|nr:probable receptor-like protein kinase At5g20050 isoform X2 [Cynara cardunculus var. scolymus]